MGVSPLGFESRPLLPLSETETSSSPEESDSFPSTDDSHVRLLAAVVVAELGGLARVVVRAVPKSGVAVSSSFRSSSAEREWASIGLISSTGDMTVGTDTMESAISVSDGGGIGCVGSESGVVCFSLRTASAHMPPRWR